VAEGERGVSVVENDKHLDAGTRLAVDRTRLAYERTLMAWVRTAASLISFGFTIYKFFQFEFKNRPEVPHLIGPREFAMMLIGIGLISLFMSTIQHRHSLRALREEYGHVVAPVSTSGVVAGLFAILGLLAFAAVWLRQ
jgi:putative membrane protein